MYNSTIEIIALKTWTSPIEINISLSNSITKKKKKPDLPMLKYSLINGNDNAFNFGCHYVIFTSRSCLYCAKKIFSSIPILRLMNHWYFYLGVRIFIDRFLFFYIWNLLLCMIEIMWDCYRFDFILIFECSSTTKGILKFIYDIMIDLLSQEQLIF